MVTRREILWAAAGAAFAARAGSAQSPDRSNPPVIDTHQHLWDLQKFRLPWLAGAGELNRTFLTADYLKAAEGLNIRKAVYMEVAVTPEQREAEAHYVIDLCEQRNTPTVAAVIGGSPGSDGFRDYIVGFKGSPYVKGVRESLRAGAAKDEAFLKGLRLLGELDMTFDFQLGPDLLPEAAAVAAACPDTRFVLDHCGGADPRDFRRSAPQGRQDRRARWMASIELLAKRPNVICKISGLLESAAPDKVTADDIAPAVNHCLDCFGPDRVVFAGNWPVVNRGGSLRRWVTLLGEVMSDRTAELRRKLMHDNAARFYTLD